MIYLVALISLTAGIALGRYIERRRSKQHQSRIEAHIKNMNDWAART